MNLIKLLKGKISKLTSSNNQNSIKVLITEIKVEYRKLLFYVVTNIHTNRIIRTVYSTFMFLLMFAPVWAIGTIWRTVQSEFYLPYEINKNSKFHNVETFKNVNDYNKLRLSYELTKYY